MPKYEEWNNMNEDEVFDTFCAVFDHELESWFSADIACCDNCYDDFLSKWPGIYSRNEEFQRNGIQLSSFYSGSYLQTMFTEEEFNKFIRMIRCPRCGSYLYDFIWPYNMSFDLPENFENIINEIAQLAGKTPFLLLSHPFAKKVFDEINKLGMDAKPIVLNKSLYRARRLKEGRTYSESDFSFNQRAEIKEGRYNHAGNPVLYLSFNAETCFHEVRKPEEGITVAEITINKPLKILDLVEIEDCWDSILNAAAWSSLMSSPMEGDGWHKPHYIFTRFIADCAISAGFDGIIYPSVRKGKGKNLVLLNGEEAWQDAKVISITLIAGDEAKKHFTKFKY